MFQNGPSNDGYTPPGRGGRAANPNAPPPGEEATPPPAPATKAPPTTKK